MNKKTATESGGVTPPASIVAALKRILKPLVRMLLHFQITFPFLSELLKSVYVDVAENELALTNKPQTDTRISLITGVHRKDTKRLRGALKEGEVLPEVVSAGAQLVAKWVSDDDYLDKKGDPIALPLRGTTPSFEGLVQSVCKQDLRPRVVLDEWERLGIASVVDDKVCLRSDAFVPQTGVDEKAFYLGMNVADHLAAAGRNIREDSSPYFERCVYYEGLDDRSIAELKSMSEKDGMKLLKKLNKRALELKAEQDKEGTRRFNTGVYVYHEKQD
ncbi:hypothetical protein A9Q99_05805 [Gammaproteobacteria bacterium 45_16_T64]|nr:hypothetical protein A9Q99_05805 [Gammaproteobacteria bacterium 45_16_T64]